MGDPRRMAFLRGSGVLAAWLLAACSSGTPVSTSQGTPVTSSPSTPGAATPAPSTSSAASAAPNPATAALTFTGDPGLAAGTTLPVVQCNFPDPVGTVITVVTAALDKSETVFVKVAPTGFLVRVTAGAAGNAGGRDFHGDSVAGFNPAKGAELSGAVTETTKAGAPTGSVPILKTVSGTIDCGGQTAGSGTVHLSGSLAEGAIDGDLDPIRVVCNPASGSGTQVVVTGIVEIGGTRTLVAPIIGPTGLASLYVATPANHSLLAPTPIGTVSGQSATFDGDVDGGAGVGRVHMSGQVTCGASG